MSAMPTMMRAPGRSRVMAGSLEVDRRLHIAELVRGGGEALGMADEEEAARAEQLPEAADELLLRGLVEVDHDVAAEDHVERSFHRPRLHQVEPGEPDQGPNVVVDAVEPGRGWLNASEVSVHQRRGETGQGILLVGRLAGPGEHGGGDIGSEDLDVQTIEVRERFAEHERNGVGLFAGGAAGAPDAAPAAGTELGNDVLAKEVEVPGFAEKARLVGGQHVDHGDQLAAARVTPDVGDVVVVVGKAERTQPLGETRLDKPFFALTQVDAAELVEQAADRLELRRGELRRYQVAAHRCSSGPAVALAIAQGP